jgi:hypothetical protein
MQERERLESVKAGVVSAIAAGSAFGLLAWGHAGLGSLWLHDPNWGLLRLETSLLDPWASPKLVEWLVGVAIALVSGALFGITYRYVVREDENSHLRSGVVLAFGLVRGMAAVQGRLGSGPLWALGSGPLWVETVLVGGESVVMFAIAQVVLAWAMGKGWVLPFANR